MKTFINHSKKILFLISLALSLQSNLFAQADPAILKAQLAAERSTAGKIDILLKLCDVYRAADFDSCLSFSRQAITLLKKEPNLAKLAKAEMFVFSYYYNGGFPDSALALVEKNIAWLEKEPSLLPELAQYYSFSGLCYMKMDRKKDALDRFYLALKKAEACKDYIVQLKARVNIGWAMMELNQFPSAIKNFHSAIQLVEEKKLTQAYTAVIYNNLASCHGSLNNVDSAYHFAQTAIKKAKENNDIVAQANGLFILGTAFEKQGKLDEALRSFLEAQPIRQKIGDPYFIVSDLAELSNLYAKMGKTTEGIQSGEEALRIAKTNKISAKLPMIYTALATNYEAAKEYNKAIDAYKKINALQDSMYADANPKALAEMQTLYETEKKVRLIEQKDNKIRFQNFLFIGIAGLVLLSGLLLHSQYKKYRFKKEAQLQAQLLQQQEQAAKAVIEAEENERQRIAKDLHDGVGQMMSAAKMNLSAFESAIQFTDTAQKISFSKAIELVDESCKEVRTVSHTMMPNVLLKNGLAAAIQDFTDKLDKNSLRVHLYTEGLEQRLDSNIEIVLYRVIQECVNNVIKHARASTLDISVIKDKDGIDATIEDNGKGFDATDKEKFEGIGLKNIITRIEYLKGTVDFDTAPGRGTVVALHVPV